MLYTQTRWASAPTSAREELMVLQLLNCEISSLISSISSVLQCTLQTGLVAYCWGCLTLPITRPCFQLFRALPSFNHLDLNSSCWVCASGWIHFRKCQPKSENICIKKSDNLYVNGLLPPVLCRKGLASVRLTFVSLKVFRKTHRSPNLLKSPALGQAARCEAQVKLWCHPQWMCFSWEVSAPMESKNVLHHHYWKQKENPHILLILINFSHSLVCLCLIFSLFHSSRV